MARTITASVGIGCANRNEDVRTIQELLNRVPSDQGGPLPPIGVDGGWGTNTQKALQTFQLKQFGWSGADGKVFPDGETLQALNRFDTGGGFSPGLPPPNTPVPIPYPTSQVSQDFRIRAVRCGVQEVPQGTISDAGYHFEVHDLTNKQVTVFTVVNDVGMAPLFSGAPKVQYREFSNFRTRSPYRLEDFRDVPTALTIFFAPTSGGGTAPTLGRLELSMPGGESVVVPVGPFHDQYDSPGTVSSQYRNCRFRLNYLPGTWQPRG